MKLVGFIVVIIIFAIIIGVRSWATWNNNHVGNPSREETFNINHNSMLQKNGLIVSNTYSYKITGTNSSLTNIIYFQIDQTNEKVIISSMGGLNEIIPFSNIIGCEIFIDSQVAGGVGRAVVGGVIAGGAGAVVGAVTAKKYIMSYAVVVYTKNLDRPQIRLNLISQKTNKSDPIYNRADMFAQNINATIKSIINQ